MAQCRVRLKSMNDSQHDDRENRTAPLGCYNLAPAQELLLRAALLQGQSALTAWEQWKDCVDIETLDAASYALLPQLYQNLLLQGVEDFHMARLKGVYRRNWYANQLQIKSLDAVLAALSETGINVIVLGDAAFNVHNGDRSISSFHLLVHPEQLELTFTTLTNREWEATTPLSDSFIQFQNRQYTLYVQGRLFWAFPQDETDRQIWQTAIFSRPSQFLLSPTDQFLEVAARTFLKAGAQSIHGLADAFLLISSHDFDWKRLATQAERYRMILPVRNMLTLLQRVLHLEIPSWMMPSLNQMSLMPEELLTYQVLAGEWQLWVRSRFLPLTLPLERRILQLRYRPFPGRRMLKLLLVHKNFVVK